MKFGVVYDVSYFYICLIADKQSELGTVKLIVISDGISVCCLSFTQTKKNRRCRFFCSCVARSIALLAFVFRHGCGEREAE